MLVYILKRIGLMLPTLLLILLANFLLVQITPSGPIERQIAKISAEQTALAQGFGIAQKLSYQGAQGLSDEMIAELTMRFGFDLPVHERFLLMLHQYARLDLGESFFQGRSVVSLIAERLPVTLLFGALCLIVMYGAGVLLGVYKAAAHGSKGDRLTMLLLAVLHALPVFMLGLLLLALFASSGVWQIFPMQGVASAYFSELSLMAKVADLLWHLTLPVLAASLGGIAGIAYLTKFSVMGEFNKPYVLAMRAHGVSGARLLYMQILKNALLPIAANMPLAVVGMLFSGNFLIEVIFGIDGIGRLGFDAVMQRDYPLMFGLVFVLTLIGMVVQLIFDVLYYWLNPQLSYHR